MNRINRILAMFLTIAVFVSLSTSISASAATSIELNSNVVMIDPWNYEDGDLNEVWGLPTIQPTGYAVYRITAPKELSYSLSVVYGCDATGNTKVTLNGEEIASVSMPRTENKTTEIMLGVLEFKKGDNFLRIDQYSRGISFYSDWILENINPSGNDYSRKNGSYRNIYIPGIINAEEFDLGADGSFVSDPNRYTQSKLRNDTNINIIDVSNENKGVYMLPGDWTQYTFIACNDGNYDVYLNSKGTFDCKVYLDGEQYIKASIENGDYVNNLIGTVKLKKGGHSLKILAVEGQINIDTITMETSDNEGISAGEGDKQAVFKEFYVSPDGNDDAIGTIESPFRTIERAKEEVKKYNSIMTGDIVVNLLPGYHQLTRTLTFDNSDSGENGYNVVYKGTQYDDKAIISGGVKITDWEKENEHIWKAKADVEDLRHFYVNGYTAQRARSKYRYSSLGYYNIEGSEYATDGLVVSALNFPEIKKNVNNVELVWTDVWANQRPQVDNIVKLNDNKLALIMRQPIWNTGVQEPHVTASVSASRPFYIENAMELLDEPGEFYFDKTDKMIYYFPYEQEDMLTAECYAANIEGLVKMEGETKDNKIHNIIFENIDFRYGTWFLINDEGIVHYVENIRYDGKTAEQTMFHGQIQIDKAKNIVIENCYFANLGSNAINMQNAVKNSRVNGCVFRDIAGSAVMVGDGTFDNRLNPEIHERAQNITISNNVVRRIGQDLFGSPALANYFVGHVDIINNDIKDVPYLGVLMGFGWAKAYPDFGNNKVVGNRVENVLTVLNDGANIYTLGTQPGTIIKENHLIKSGDTRGGIYLDDYSSNITVQENVIEQCERWLYLWVPSIKMITATNNYSDTDNILNEATQSVVSDNTTVKDGNWPEPAIKIMNAAGVEKEYKHLLNDVELPPWRDNIHQEVPNDLFVSKNNIKINAYEYDGGGEGVGYHDIDAGNKGSAKHRNDDVDMWTSSTIAGAYDVGVDSGEWMKYSVFVPKGGKYNVQAWSMNITNLTEQQPAAKITVDGKVVIDDAYIGNTGTSASYNYTDMGNIELEAGEHEFIVEGKYAFWGVTFLNLIPISDGIMSSDDFDEGIYVEQEKEEGLSDIIGHWAENDINKMFNKGIIKGVGNGIFDPEGIVSKHQAALMLLRSLNINDSVRDWKQEAVKINLLSQDDIEHADEPVSREKLADMVMNAHIKRNATYELTYDMNAFKDFSLVDSAYINSVLAAKKYGYIIGDENNCFNPKSYLTRAEASVIVNRFIN